MMFMQNMDYTSAGHWFLRASERCHYHHSPCLQYTCTAHGDKLSNESPLAYWLSVPGPGSLV